VERHACGVAQNHFRGSHVEAYLDEVGVPTSVKCFTDELQGFVYILHRTRGKGMVYMKGRERETRRGRE